MTSSIFCPFCQRKNKADATHCIYCGVQFTADETEVFTTRKISDFQAVAFGKKSRCAEHLAGLSEGALVLFIMNEEEPIVLESVHQVILGRHVEDSSVPTVDLSGYAAVERGVSRQHVQITYSDGVYTLVDLGSTNGTWLNQGRLIPGKSYQLHSSDQISLGRLRITTCFQADDESEDIMFYLRDSTVPLSVPHHLTPQYLMATVLPYLQAIIEIQELCQEFRGLVPQKVNINAISSIKHDPTLIISLAGAADMVRLLQKRVIPWRKTRTEAALTDETEVSPQMKLDLKQLALEIVSDLVPDASDSEQEENCVMLLSPLTVVALSSLVLIA